MPTRGVSKVRRRMKERFSVKIPRQAEIAANAATIIIANAAMVYTPLDTGDLQNSQRRNIERTSFRITGIVGYYGPNYAGAIHDRTDWTPRPPNHPGKVAAGYNPKAKPRFLYRAAVEKRKEVRETIKQVMKTKL